MGFHLTRDELINISRNVNRYVKRKNAHSHEEINLWIFVENQCYRFSLKSHVEYVRIKSIKSKKKIQPLCFSKTQLLDLFLKISFRPKESLDLFH